MTFEEEIKRYERQAFIILCVSEGLFGLLLLACIGCVLSAVL